MTAARFVAKGRVQGVSFRAFTRIQARNLGVDGYVFNRPDGSVEGLAQGEPAALLSLRSALEGGPKEAQVTELLWEEAPLQDLIGFEIRR